MIGLFYFLSGAAFIIGGFVLYFRDIHKVIAYYSLGFILLGIQVIFNGIIFPNELVELVFIIPSFLAAIIFLVGGLEYFKEEKTKKKRKKK